MLSDLKGSIRIYRSPYVERGKIIILGAGDKYPEDWKSRTKDEQIRWAVKHGYALMINNLENIDAE